MTKGLIHCLTHHFFKISGPITQQLKRFSVLFHVLCDGRNNTTSSTTNGICFTVLFQFYFNFAHIIRITIFANSLTNCLLCQLVWLPFQRLRYRYKRGRKFPRRESQHVREASSPWTVITLTNRQYRKTKKCVGSRRLRRAEGTLVTTARCWKVLAKLSQSRTMEPIRRWLATTSPKMTPEPTFASATMTPTQRLRLQWVS